MITDNAVEAAAAERAAWDAIAEALDALEAMRLALAAWNLIDLIATGGR